MRPLQIGFLFSPRGGIKSASQFSSPPNKNVFFFADCALFAHFINSEADGANEHPAQILPPLSL